MLTAQSQERNKNVREQQYEGGEYATSDIATFEMDLDRLRDYSDEHSFAMHKLVQFAMRKWLAQHFLPCEEYGLRYGSVSTGETEQLFHFERRWRGEPTGTGQ